MASAAITAIVTGLTAVVAGTVTTTAGFFAVAAIVAGGQLLIESLSKTDDTATELPTQTVVASVQNARWIVGRARVAGSLVWIAHSGRNLHMILVLSEGELDGIEKIYAGGEEVLASKINNRWSGTGRWEGRIAVWEHFDNDAADRGQSAIDADIGWTSDHRLDGISYVHVRLNQNNYGDRADRRFWTGVPNLEFCVRGIKLQNPALTTPTFSSNSADVFYWWLTERRGIPAEEINRSYFLAARSVCGNTNFFSDGAMRYETNGLISSGDSAVEIQRQLEYGIAGAVVEYDGEQRIIPGTDRPSMMDIGEDAIISEPIIQVAPAQIERINEVSSTLLQDKDFNYQSRDVPPVADDVAKGRDGETLATDLGQLRFINTQQAAQYLAAVALRQARAGQQLQLEVSPGSNLERLSLVPGQIVSVSIGEYAITNVPYYINRVETQPGQAVKLTLQERPDDLFSTPTFVAPPLAMPTPIPDEDLEGPAGLTAETIVDSPSTIQASIGIKVSWTQSPYNVIVEARKGSGDPLRAEVAPGNNTATLHPAGIGTWFVSAFNRSPVAGITSIASQITHVVEQNDMPRPPPPQLRSAEQIGRGFRVRYRQPTETDAPDPAGLDIRYNRRNFGETTPLVRLTEDTWEDAERLLLGAVAPQVDDSPAITDALVERDGHYRLFMRSSSVLGVQSDIVEVGFYDLVRADSETFQQESSPNFAGDFKDASVYVGTRRLVLPTRDDLSNITDEEWNGESGWPFGNTTDSTYQSQFFDTGTVQEIRITPDAEYFIPTSTTPDSPTLQIIHKDTESGKETIVDAVNDTQITITARFVSVKATFAEQAIEMLGITGRYDATI